jgi:hypothetical protein
MNRNSFPESAVEQIKAAGYRIFMRNRADSYAIFGDDTGVAYVQFEPMAGYTVSTSHVPNKESGTGYQIERHVPELTPEMLRRAVKTVVPSWHRHDKAPTKYASVDAYTERDAWTRSYSEV